MNSSKKLPSELPSMEFDFSIEVQGEISGRKLSGDFKYKIPNLKAKSMADKKRAELSGGLDAMLDASVLNLHMMIAYLRYSILEAPSWWKDADWGYNLYDYNVVREVYDKVQDFEAEYMKAIWGDPDESKDSSST